MAAAPSSTVFDEILEFLSSAPSAEAIVRYEPPDALQQRLSQLLEKNRQDTLSSDERHELDEFLQMNRFMSRLKLKARKHIQE